MTKRFLYEFNGTVFVEAENEDEAEKLIIGIPLADYLVDEDIYEINDSYMAVDLEFLRKQVYMSAFLEFFDGNIDRKELFKRIEKFENSDNFDFLPIERITMIDLKTKTQKTVRHIVVD